MEDLREQFLQQRILAMQNERLRLTLMPTEKCNFRCVYCYEDFKIGKMHRSVVCGIKNFLNKKIGQLKQLDIAWFGGEPLLAPSTIFEISAFILEKMGKHQRLVYNSGITTNGYLLDSSMFKDLVLREIRTFQVSLDGDQVEHDNTRLRADCGNTFRRIWDNLVSASNSNCRFTMILRVHYNREKIDSLVKLMRKINNTFTGDKRFLVHFAAIEPLGGPNLRNITKMDETEKKEIVKILMSYLDDNIELYDPTSRGISVCYAAQANALVIRANGRLAKCTVALNDESNDIGYINEDGTLSVDQPRYQLWLRGWENADIATLACPYSSIRTIN